MGPAGPYRDLGARRQGVEEGRAAARRRAKGLRGAERRRLPPTLRAELTDLEPTIAQPIDDEDALRKAEDALERYLVAVDAALEIIEQDGDFRRKTARRRWTMRGIAIAVLTGLVGGGWLVGARYATYSSDCAMSSDCARFGLCHASWAQAMRGEAGECIARDASDCAEPCRVWGRCEHANDRCGAASDEHCHQSLLCRELGACHVVRSGVQWRATTGSCARARW